MAVPALLPLLPKAMGVGFVELGVAIAVFNIVSALVQAPLGFMVDKWGARRMLMAALSLGALSFGLLALVPTYHCLLLAMGDRKSTRLNSSHVSISYAVFCLK